jgi:hypothetical protein
MDHAAHPTNGSGHETTEVSVKFIVTSLFALLIGVFLACLLVVGIFQFFHHTYLPDSTSLANPQQLPPEPRVEEHPWEQIQDLRKHEDHVLSTYAIIDKNQGTVRIPVDRAIDLLAQKGLPSHDYMSDMSSGKKSPSTASPTGGEKK